MCYLCDKDEAGATTPHEPPPDEVSGVLLRRIAELNSLQTVRCSDCGAARMLDADSVHSASRFHFSIAGTCVGCGGTKQMTILKSSIPNA